MHSVSRVARLQESVSSYRQGASTYMVEESTRLHCIVLDEPVDSSEPYHSYYHLSVKEYNSYQG